MIAATWLSRTYDDALPTAGQRAAFWLLIGLLLSYLFIRTSARLMRSPKVPWWPGSVTSGDLHVHHLVFGICILLLTGFLGFALQASSPWLEILAALFGIGAGLTLDEFALWLYLDDVYWKEEGRKSFGAVVIAVSVGGLVLLGAVPWDPGEDASGFWGVALVIAVNVGLCVANVLKGKYVMALLALFIPLIGWIGLFRLAAPRSPWARWFYRKPRKLERAEHRRERVDARWRRWTDRVAGAPEVDEGARRAE